MIIRKVLVVLVAFLLSVSIQAQDLEHIGKQKPFQLSGGVGLSYSYTIANDSNPVAMPFFWNANVNLNMSVYGISIPVSAMITNGRFDFQHSFKQFGLSPTYKWLTLHGGYRQYSYSPFSVSGQTFLGGGFEAHPLWLRLGFFIGRLRKAADIDTSMVSQTIPGSYPLHVTSVNGTNFYSQAGSFSRWGWGAKLGFGKEKNFVDLILFKGKDRIASITDTFSKKILKPEENLVIGINSFQKIGKHVNFGFDGAASIYTYDMNVDTLPIDEQIPLKSFFAMLTPVNLTTQLQCAASVSLGVMFKNFSVKTQYRRVDPYYKSMGIASNLSDLELGSAQIAWSVFKQKVRFTHMAQYQHDNLNKYKRLTTNRLMLNSAISINASNKWGLDISYNNFGLKQQKTRPDVSDSLKIFQESNTLTLVPRYIIFSPKYTDVISLVASYSDMTGGSVMVREARHIRNLYATLNNTLVLNKNAWSINTGLNYNMANTGINKLTSFGLIAGVAKSLFKNTLSLSNTNTFLWNILDGNGNGNTFATDLTVSYVLLTKHNFGMGLNYVYSPSNGIYNTSDLSQLRIVGSYQYNF